MHKCLRIDLMQLCLMKISFPQTWVLGLNAWRNSHVRARKKVQVHLLSHECLLLKSNKLTFTLHPTLLSLPLSPSFLCVTTSSLSLLFFWVTDYLCWSLVSYDTFSTPLGLVPAHPALDHASSCCTDDLLLTLHSAGTLRDTALLATTQSKRAAR